MAQRNVNKRKALLSVTDAIIIGKISNDETVLSWTLGITGNKSGSERPQSLLARADFLISF